MVLRMETVDWRCGCQFSVPPVKTFRYIISTANRRWICRHHAHLKANQRRPTRHNLRTQFIPTRQPIHRSSPNEILQLPQRAIVILKRHILPLTTNRHQALMQRRQAKRRPIQRTVLTQQPQQPPAALRPGRMVRILHRENVVEVIHQQLRLVVRQRSAGERCGSSSPMAERPVRMRMLAVRRRRKGMIRRLRPPKIRRRAFASSLYPAWALLLLATTTTRRIGAPFHHRSRRRDSQRRRRRRRRQQRSIPPSHNNRPVRPRAGWKRRLASRRLLLLAPGQGV